MAAVTASVVGAAVAIKGQQDAAKARRSAARKQRQAAETSAQFIGQAGRRAAEDIEESELLARGQLREGALRAEKEISPFTKATRGFTEAKRLTMAGADIGGPIGEAIRLGAVRGAQGAAFSPIAEPIMPEVERQAQLAVSAATPELRQALLDQGAVGIGAVGDISQIRGGRFRGLAELASGAAGQRATALVGAVPELTRLAGSAQEARVLSDIAGQQGRTRTIEELARLGGRVF